MKRLLIIAIACLVAPIASAELYKYVDKDGKTVYSDQPPVNIDSKQMNIQSRPSSTAGSSRDRARARRNGACGRSKSAARAGGNGRAKGARQARPLARGMGGSPCRAPGGRSKGPRHGDSPREARK